MNNADELLSLRAEVERLRRAGHAGTSCEMLARQCIAAEGALSALQAAAETLIHQYANDFECSLSLSELDDHCTDCRNMKALVRALSMYPLVKK